ncbi:Molybdenum cofactor sulfurase 1 [Spatholobus suberectus]|nr:Molybdenum cofactor sulfurase 1 [Spatholobus suberectus]
MHPPCAGEASQPCYNACFPSFLASYPDKFHNTPNSSHDFEAATSSTLHPYTQFTNHEALPSLEESYINFTKAYPPFGNTSQVDQIRAQEYHHLNPSNICFDYTGYGLFSHAQEQTTSAASSYSCPPPSLREPPFFVISYKPVTLHSQILYGGQEFELESKIRERIMAFMNISEADYALVFIANEVSAFKLIADSFQFQPDGELLTVYDHKSEAVDAMIEICKEQGIHVLSAKFYWPSLRIMGRKLKKMIMSRRGKRKRGLFVFPLHSRVTGTPYSYIWMSLAQENGWRVLLDARALGPKEMDTLGLTMFKPDFMVCSFYKVFGENPSGFGCLFIKKSSISALKESRNPTSMVIIGLSPVFRQETEPKARQEDGSVSPHGTEQVLSSEIVELSPSLESGQSRERLGTVSGGLEIECRGLDHADSVGLMVISCRGKYLINWLVNALMSLQHPHPPTGLSLIRIYGPKISSHRGHVVAFNVFDWKGEKVDPAVVQKLADRNNISLSSAFLQSIWFSDRSDEETQRTLESRVHRVKVLGQSNKTQKSDFGITVVTAALSLLTNFEDVYRLWAFLSRFLDADFVQKERWRYMALNQKTIDI